MGDLEEEEEEEVSLNQSVKINIHLAKEVGGGLNSQLVSQSVS